MVERTETGEERRIAERMSHEYQDRATAQWAPTPEFYFEKSSKNPYIFRTGMMNCLIAIDSQANKNRRLH